MEAMKSVLVLEPVPTEIEALIQRRHALGLDTFDEVWEGVYHMTPGPSGPHAYLLSRLIVLLEPYAKAAGLVSVTGFNLGPGPDDYRVPDSGFLREIPAGVWLPTAAVVVEILSPGDETYDKFGFYSAHGVEEIFVVDPATRSFKIWRRGGEDVPSYHQTGASAVLAITAADMMAAIDWPDA